MNEDQFREWMDSEERKQAVLESIAESLRILVAMVEAERGKD